mgnify:CR=1 FL=1
MLQILTTGVLVLVPLVLSVTLHETGHVLVARLLGDDTAVARGRWSLNPWAHLDWLGTVAVPLLAVLFNAGALFGAAPYVGWGQPVPVNAGRFTRRVSVRAGSVAVAVAGPLANALLAAGFWVLWALGPEAGTAAGGTGTELWRLGFRINVGLVLINVLPLYPLDGHRILAAVLPPSKALRLERFNYRYGLLVLVGVLLAGHAALGWAVAEIESFADAWG